MPRNPSAVSGGEFSHFTAPVSGGSAPSTGKAASIRPGAMVAPAAPSILPGAIMARAPVIIAGPSLATTDDDARSPAPDLADPDPAASGRAAPVRSSSFCSSAAVVVAEIRVRNPVSSPSAIAMTPTRTAAPRPRRIHSPAPSDLFMAANTRPPASSASASEVAAPAA